MESSKIPFGLLTIIKIFLMSLEWRSLYYVVAVSFTVKYTIVLEMLILEA